MFVGVVGSGWFVSAGLLGNDPHLRGRSESPCNEVWWEADCRLWSRKAEQSSASAAKRVALSSSDLLAGDQGGLLETASRSGVAE